MLKCLIFVVQPLQFWLHGMVRGALSDVEELGAEIVGVCLCEVGHSSLPQVPHSPGRAGRDIPPDARFESAGVSLVPVCPGFAGSAACFGNMCCLPPLASFGLSFASWPVIDGRCVPAASRVSVFVRSPLPNIFVSPPSARSARRGGDFFGPGVLMGASRA